MSGSLTNPVALFTLLLFFFGMIAIFHSKTAYAEPMFLLKSENIKKTDEKTDKTSTLRFDDQGNLTVRKDNLTIILICNPPGSENEVLRNKDPALMAINRQNPEITGVGIKISFAF